MKFIQVRGSGDVYYYTPELAKRDDVDVIEGPSDATPDDVQRSLAEIRERLRQEADEVAREAEKAFTARVAQRTAKVAKVPEGVKVERKTLSEKAAVVAEAEAAVKAGGADVDSE
jgi:uncharacterized protein YukE